MGVERSAATTFRSRVAALIDHQQRTDAEIFFKTWHIDRIHPEIDATTVIGDYMLSSAREKAAELSDRIAGHGYLGLEEISAILHAEHRNGCFMVPERDGRRHVYRHSNIIGIGARDYGSEHPCLAYNGWNHYNVAGLPGAALQFRRRQDLSNTPAKVVYMMIPCGRLSCREPHRP